MITLKTSFLKIRQNTSFRVSQVLTHISSRLEIDVKRLPAPSRTHQMLGRYFWPHAHAESVLEAGLPLLPVHTVGYENLSKDL